MPKKSWIKKKKMFSQIHPIMVMKKKTKKNMFCFFKNTLLWWSKNYIYFVLKSPYYGLKKNHEFQHLLCFWSISHYNDRAKKNFFFVFFGKNPPPLMILKKKKKRLKITLLWRPKKSYFFVLGIFAQSHTIIEIKKTPLL